MLLNTRRIVESAENSGRMIRHNVGRLVHRRPPRPLFINAGAIAVGALAIGALAIGTIAIFRLAIARLAVARGEVRDLSIENLHVRRLSVAAKEGEAYNPYEPDAAERL